MKEVVRYQALTIPTKVKMEVRIIVDDRGIESQFNGDGSRNTTIAPRPFIVLQLMRPAETDENGQRIKSPWDPSDSISMTKFNYPVFLRELRGIQKDMEIPDLYTYHGERLEINEEAAQKVRRVFMISNTTLELSAQVIVQSDESRVEGIKMKFNNEQHSVMLTLNEIETLAFNIEHTNFDALALLMYVHFMSRPNAPKTIPQGTFQPNVDIIPK